MKDKLEDLKTRLQEVDDINGATALLGWDQTTYMPPGGSPARARQLATLGRLSHEKFTDAAIGKLLDELEKRDLPYDSDDAALLRVTRRAYDQLVKLPNDFIGELNNHTAMAYSAWTEARPNNDFAGVRANLEKTLELSCRLADYFPGYKHIADPLIDFADYGMNAEMVRKVFSELREELVPIAQAITSQAPADDSCLHLHYPEEKQKAFGENVIRDYGFDFKRGRQDKTHHPFMTKFSLGDIRITTRFNEHDLSDGLFSTLHEAGHAMYEMGIRMDFEGLPLAGGTSSGVHESQSRTWENIVGRSRNFWTRYYPDLQRTFPEELGAVELDTFYRAINKVQRSLIRTDADEVTYNLHVMIRFDFELDMLEGKLAIKDLPEAWHARYQSDLGTRAPDDRDGVLQDVHWYGGLIGGAFQGYTLGNIMSAQFYEAALKAHPNIPGEMAQGKFDVLHNWLKENIYQHGSKFTANELLERVTGGPLSIKPYIKYLKTKYGELYKL